jgi:hypothetical protein
MIGKPYTLLRQRRDRRPTLQSLSTSACVDPN